MIRGGSRQEEVVERLRKMQGQKVGEWRAGSGKEAGKKSRENEEDKERIGIR